METESKRISKQGCECETASCCDGASPTGRGKVISKIKRILGICIILVAATVITLSIIKKNSTQRENLCKTPRAKTAEATCTPGSCCPK